MIVAILAAIAGLLIGTLVAAAWTAGFRQGRSDVLSIARTLAARYYADLVDEGGERLTQRGIERH